MSSCRENKIDLLAFAPHPDDAELFCGGLLAKAAASGYCVGIVDLTQGELSSQGSIESRTEEAKKASEILGLSLRENLSLPDGKLGREHTLSPDGESLQLSAIVASLRRLRPDIICAPYWEERHPDHVESSKLISQAVFFSGLKKFQPKLGPAHSVQQLMYYQMRHSFTPSFVCDITSVQTKKMEAIASYQSQISRQDDATAEGAPTLISSPLTLSSIEARDRYFGSMIGAEYGEAFLVKEALAINDPIAHFRERGEAKPLLFPKCP